MVGSIVLSIRMTRFIKKYFSKNTKNYQKIFGTKKYDLAENPKSARNPSNSFWEKS